jgi:hypothetical protein
MLYCTHRSKEQQMSDTMIFVVFFLFGLAVNILLFQ